MRKLTDKERENRMIKEIMKRITSLEKRYHQSLVQSACNRYIVANREKKSAQTEIKELEKKMAEAKAKLK